MSWSICISGTKPEDNMKLGKRDTAAFPGSCTDNDAAEVSIRQAAQRNEL